MLTLASLFDGIGGWLIAAHRNGIKPVWSSEIEDFPMKVSKAHFPDVEQLGDVTKINGGKVPPVDIICAGSPCQDLSVAGNQKGLAGSRSNLFFESVRIVREMREATNGIYPKFFVWENVTGAFSSNHGHDFQAVLREIAETDIPMPGTGRWAKAGMVRSERVGIAWRVLDAQYWGVPQRRSRIFLIADFAEKNRCAAEVIFVEQSVPRDLEKSGTTGKEVASFSRIGTEASSGDCKLAYCIAGNVINRKDKNGGHHLGVDENKEVPLYDISHLSDGVREIPMGASNTLTAHMGTGGGNVAVLNEADRQKTDDARTVRRLTVTECERLQGLPDGYTAYGSDTARYKALGNGMAQPCADFIISKVVEAFEKDDS